MQKHVHTILGLIMLPIFALRLAEALASPGLGWAEAYAFGGLALGLILTASGVRQHWRARTGTGTRTPTSPSA